MSKRQVNDKSLSAQRLDPNPKRIDSIGDSEDEGQSSSKCSSQTASGDNESKIGRESSDYEDKACYLRRLMLELTVALTSRNGTLTALLGIIDMPRTDAPRNCIRSATYPRRSHMKRENSSPPAGSII